MSDESKPTMDDCGSRDLVRNYLKQAGELVVMAAEEVAKLRAANKLLEYRYCDAYLATILSFIELARIVMRKRKRRELRQAASGSAPQPISTT